ncbi:MAG: flagellin [Ramlibacter sp.]|uniref:flagellin N-terminal helical domain-containing protein n=1 Tax=Ramlibacter sp. TaxID=1917967 RepID=UPI00262C7A43|nr:flagellin [Ramlibacter sp.]MDH4376699.1 flagellin [Ramlibacter sp.]
MSTVINTNTKSLIAQQALNVNNRGLSKAMEQLSTGKRINTAADDAAGLAISNKMTSQIRGLTQGVRNANDAISMIQTAEGATNEVTNMLQRMRELAVQAANGTYNTEDRTSLQSEFSELQAEITRISSNTEWNGTKIADGTMTAVNFQVGANSSQVITVTFKDIDGMTGMTTAIVSASISSVGVANSAISAVDTALATIDSFRSDMGAKINRLTYAADNLTNVMTNTGASRSRILDADYAKTATDLARTQIIQQAATAMLAQANQEPQSVLSLLKG